MQNNQNQQLIVTTSIIQPNESAGSIPVVATPPSIPSLSDTCLPQVSRPVYFINKQEQKIDECK